MANMYNLREFDEAILIAANISSEKESYITANEETQEFSSVNLVDLLHKLVQDYVTIGRPVLTGFAGRVFDDEQAKAYREAKVQLETAADVLYKGENLTTDRLARILDSEEIKEIRARCAGMSDSDKFYNELVEAGEIYLKLRDEAIKLASTRYIKINEYVQDKLLVNLDGVLGVLGVHDTSSWNGEQRMKMGVDDVRYGHKKKGKFRFAYFGGYNYPQDFLQDAPDQLTMRTGDEVLGKFLLETPFDALLFSGDRRVIKTAIDSINLSRSRQWFGGNKSGIRGKVIVVTDPREQLPKIDYDGVNTIVTGANYHDKGKLVLIDPVDRNVAILKYYRGGDINDAEREAGKMGMLDSAVFELVKARNFVSGKGVEVQDINRKHLSFGDHVSNVGSHISTAIRRGYRTVSAPANVGALRRAIPYVVAGAVGAAAGSLATAFAISGKHVESDRGLTDTVKKLEQDLKDNERELKANNDELQRRDKILEGMRKNIGEVKKKLEESNK